MMMVRLLDVELQLPPDHHVEDGLSQRCTRFYTIRGGSLGEIRTSLERLASARGYEVRHTDHGTFLRRGEQRMEVYDLDPSRLGIRVDDAEALPRSTITREGISLGGVSLTLPPGAAIEPGRERHAAGSNEWLAQWRVSAIDGDALAEALLAASLKFGLRSYGIWKTKPGGPQSWTVEASSYRLSVQARIAPEEEHLALEIVVVADEATTRSLTNGDFVTSTDRRLDVYETMWTSEASKYALIEAEGGRSTIFDLTAWAAVVLDDANVYAALLDRLWTAPAPMRHIKQADLDLATDVRAAVRSGASFHAVVDLIHDRLGVARYQRTPVVSVLRLAFLLELRDAADLVSCDLFGSDGTTTLADAQRTFEQKVATKLR